MSNKKVFVIYTFLFIIPYILCLSLIGVCYNALIFHYNSWWRLIVCALIGAILMVATKTIAHRPIRIITEQTTNKHFRSIINFFNIDYSSTNFYLNFLIDFCLTIVFAKLIRALFSLSTIQGTMVGWIITLLILSLLLASNLEYSILSINPDQK